MDHITFTEMLAMGPAMYALMPKEQRMGHLDYSYEQGVPYMVKAVEPSYREAQQLSYERYMALKAMRAEEALAKAPLLFRGPSPDLYVMDEMIAVPQGRSYAERKAHRRKIAA